MLVSFVVVLVSSAVFVLLLRVSGQARESQILVNLNEVSNEVNGDQTLMLHLPLKITIELNNHPHLPIRLNTSLFAPLKRIPILIGLSTYSFMVRV